MDLADWWHDMEEKRVLTVMSISSASERMSTGTRSERTREGRSGCQLELTSASSSYRSRGCRPSSAR